jgi:hypothetical protein
MNEYTTTSLVQAEIRADTAFSSSTIPTSSTVSTWIQEASAEIELRTGDVFTSTSASSTLFDYDGSGIFRLPYSDLVGVTKVEYNTSSLGNTANWITLQEGDTYDYIKYLDEGEIHFVSGINSSNDVHPNPGKQKLRVSYVYGYSSVPLQIQRLATLLVAKRIIMSLASSQANTEGGEIQIGTIRITDPSGYSVNYIKSMNEEIKDIYDSLGTGMKTFRMTRVYDL